MRIIQIQSVEAPFTDPRLARSASDLLGRTEAMGLLGDRGPVSVLGSDLVAEVLRALAREGLMQRASLQGSLERLPTDVVGLGTLLREANEVLEDSPIPAREWPALRSALGDGLLARLCGISEVSLRRYMSGARTTPDAVAQRLHTLALIVADLRGAYNDYGVRRWFQRPRAQLGDRAPEDALPAAWSPDSPEAQRLRELAGALTGSPAT